VAKRGAAWPSLKNAVLSTAELATTVPWMCLLHGVPEDIAVRYMFCTFGRSVNDRYPATIDYLLWEFLTKRVAKLLGFTLRWHVVLEACRSAPLGT
jgi:hypothetical protein